jgi:TonB family protein
MKQMISLFSLLAVVFLFSNCTASNQSNKLSIMSPQAIQYGQQGKMLANNKNYEEAISYYNKAIQLMPANIHFLCDRGRSYLLNGKNSEAMADFNRAIELDPNASNAYFYRGAVYMKEEKVDKAIIEFNMATQIMPDLAEAYLYRGIAFEKKGEIDKADLDKKRAKELEPRVEAVFKKTINPEVDEPFDPDAIYTMIEVDIPPTTVYLAIPPVPFEAHANKISGSVLVKFVVTKEGKAKDIKIIKASPKGLFEAAATQAVEQSRFNPAVKNGQVVNASVYLPINFGTQGR